jgi:hypothetical protein
MWDFSIGRSFAMMAKTAPFIVFRIIVYFGIAVAYVLVTGVGAGVGWGVGAFGDDEFRAASTFWGGTIGFGLTAGVIYFLREYILYIVKAGHIAVLVKLIDDEPVPDGQGQIAYATEVVKERFAEASVLFAVDQLVKGVLAAIIGIVQGVAALLPIPYLSNLVGLIRAFLRIAVGFVDEVILAYAIRTGATNPWASAQTALVLYAQNYRVMLKNAAWLTVITYGLVLLVFLVMLAPAALVVYLIPGGWSAGGFVFALVFAWAVKAALIEPFAIACMMQAYFKTIAGRRRALSGISASGRCRASSTSSRIRPLGGPAARAKAAERIRAEWVHRHEAGQIRHRLRDDQPRAGAAVRRWARHGARVLGLQRGHHAAADAAQRAVRSPDQLGQPARHPLPDQRARQAGVQRAAAVRAQRAAAVAGREVGRGAGHAVSRIGRRTSAGVSRRRSAGGRRRRAA